METGLVESGMADYGDWALLLLTFLFRRGTFGGG